MGMIIATGARASGRARYTVRTSEAGRVRRWDVDDWRVLRNKRMANWGQTPATSTPDLESATALIARLGLVTLYPVSPEVPNLLHAYTGDPTTRAASDWDSDSGHVYTWRW